MKVVTIDFDIIMNPTIDYYNHLVPTLTWDQLTRDPIVAFFNGDFKTYQRLTQWLVNIIKILPKEKIIFIDSHAKLVEQLDIENEHYSIINIDHHHDMGYPEILNDTITKNKELNNGNWVKYLMRKNILDSYVWLRNPNSIFVEDAEDFPVQTELIQNYNLDNLKPDLLIICFSPEWIPPHIQPLFDTWIDIISSFYGVSFEIK